MAATRRLNELRQRSIQLLELPQPPLTVALSGGADSAALAYLVSSEGVEVDALHIQHQLPGSALLEAAATRIAAELGITMRVETVDVRAGPSLEAQARVARYEVLEREGRPVLTAHTLDDNAETILLNLVRGTGPTGLTGIPWHRPPNIYRPMLSVARSMTRELASLAGLGYSDDPMNSDLAYARNRVRQQVIPLLNELNPQSVEALARAARTVTRDSSFLDGLASRYLGDEIPVAILATIPRPVADRILVAMLSRAGIEPSSDRLDRMWQVVRGDVIRHDLAGGRSVVRRDAILVIE